MRQARTLSSTSTLVGLALLALAGCATMDSAPTRHVDFLSQGRADVQLFYGKDKSLDDFYDQLADATQKAVTKDQIGASNQQLLSRIGGEQDMLGEKVKTVRGMQVYVRTFHCVTAPGPFDFLVYMDPAGKIIDYKIKAHEDHTAEKEAPGGPAPESAPDANAPAAAPDATPAAQPAAPAPAPATPPATETSAPAKG